MTKIYDCGPSITEEDLKRVETSLQVALPTEYRRLLLSTNGGLVSPDAFTCNDGDEESIAWLYSIWPGDDNDILVRASVREGRLPKNFIAIGTDGGGNEICIACDSGPDYGKLYFWDHEMEADESQGMTPETAGNVHLIADSVTEFLASLYEIPVDDTKSGAECFTPEGQEGLFEEMMQEKGPL